MMADSFCCWDGDILVLNVLGTPGAKQDAIGKVKGNQLKISVTAAPESGRATDHISMKEAGVPAEWLAHAMGMATQIKANLTPAWAQQQVFFALSNAVYGAKSLGLDSCPMTGFDPAQVSRVLGLPAHLVPTALCPVGYAADAPMPKARLSRSDFLI